MRSAVKDVMTAEPMASTEIADELTAAIGRVPGVVRVESYPHQPGQPAPNKAAARHLTG